MNFWFGTWKLFPSLNLSKWQFYYSIFHINDNYKFIGPIGSETTHKQYILHTTGLFHGRWETSLKKKLTLQLQSDVFEVGLDE